jgi:hypothetical protein
VNASSEYLCFLIAAIREGRCMLGPNPFVGSLCRVPARSEVQAGSRGSYEYVLERRGKTWADKMAAL